MIKEVLNEEAKESEVPKEVFMRILFRIRQNLEKSGKIVLEDKCEIRKDEDNKNE